VPHLIASEQDFLKLLEVEEQAVTSSTAVLESPASTLAYALNLNPGLTEVAVPSDVILSCFEWRSVIGLMVKASGTLPQGNEWGNRM